jgi:hypothetical protein
VKRLQRLIENLGVPELTSRLYGRARTRRGAARDLRRVLRVPEQLEPRCLLATFVVDQVSDMADFDLGDGVADSDAGTPGVQISLRSAIQNANLDAILDNISFNIPGAGVKSISPTSPLPVISQPVVIDGYTQPGATRNMLGVGSNASILIHLNGQLLLGGSGLTISAGGSTVRGLSITRFPFQGIEIQGPGNFSTIAGNFIGVPPAGNVDQGNTINGVLINNSAGNLIGGASPGDRNVISGNNSNGVALGGANATDNIIRGNYIGTNAAGDGDIGNTDDGVVVSELLTGGGMASRTLIGGTFPGTGNVISGNNGSGVSLLGAGSQLNQIQGNRIGTNAEGIAALGNSFHGVLIAFFAGVQSASNNTIGGDDDDDGQLDGVVNVRNIISGNGRAGIAMFGVGATGNKVQGNYIGTNLNGALSIPNGNDGVRLGDASLGAGPSGNFIGGKTPGAGNLISGNTDNGIELAGATTSGNFIEGNLIGTDAATIVAVPNSRIGVFVDGAANTIIGGPTPTARNVISGNSFAGIRLTKATATGNKIEGNFIGVKMNGTSALGNQDAGVLIDNGASINVVGGTTPEAGNIIAYSLRDGVLIESGTKNTVRLNSIHSNGGVGIDLNADKESLNDHDDADMGANDSQNWPEIVRILLEGLFVRTTGFFEGKNNTAYTLDFYASSGTSPLSLGEGEEHLSTETLTTDADGYVEWTFLVPWAFPLGSILTVTATDPEGNTSEFSHDADVDGLYDHWESGRGIDGNNDGTADFFLAGANPLHKDLYVEVDAMTDPITVTNRAPSTATLARVAAAFAAAPNTLVNNPDSQNGVTLHAMLDETTLMLMDFPNKFADFKIAKASSFGTAAERSSPNATNILAAKRLAFRYAIFANTHSGGTSSGAGEIGGNDFMVTLGGWTLIGGTADQQAGTFMHELGHTLGLLHGGDDNTQFKPNYYSVMNYLWQTPKPAYSARWGLNYSTQKLPHLDESNLNESVGIGGQAGIQVPIGPKGGPRRLADMNLPVDWSLGDEDQDGTLDNDSGVAIDVNEDGGMSLLTGFEDWSHLVYAFRQSSYFDDGVVFEPDPNDIELTLELDQQINDELVDLTGDYNFNGAVDAADYVLWRHTVGSSTELRADGSGNGIIDHADYMIWRANFGKTLPPPASRSGAGAVALLPQRQDLAEVAARLAEPATSEPVANEVRRANSYSVAIAHFDHRSSNITIARGIGARLTEADRSYLAARRDDALFAWLATLATNDPSNDADRLLEVDTNRASADSADVGLTIVDLALETMDTASI